MGPLAAVKPGRDDERVVDVPAKLSARARLFDTGHNPKTDAHDAHAVAVIAVRTPTLRVLSYDLGLEALRDTGGPAAGTEAEPGSRRSTGCNGCLTARRRPPTPAKDCLPVNIATTHKFL